MSFDSNFAVPCCQPRQTRRRTEASSLPSCDFAFAVLVTIVAIRSTKTKSLGNLLLAAVSCSFRVRQPWIAAYLHDDIVSLSFSHRMEDIRTQWENCPASIADERAREEISFSRSTDISRYAKETESDSTAAYPETKVAIPRKYNC